MTDVAALIADLVAAGTPAALVGRVAAAVIEAMRTQDETYTAAEKKPCWVYVIAPYDDEFPIKVGISDWPQGRLAMLQSGSPVALKIVGSVECSSRLEAIALEASYHRTYASRRLHGEWFECNAEMAVAWLSKNAASRG